MSMEENKDAEDVKKTPVKDRFPRIVIIIVIAEFCERFSYSGMRAFLTIYLRSKLGYSDDGATEIYHLFSTLVYMFPILGGIVADNYLGKFRTILYMLFVYAAGNILVAVTAIPQLALPGRLCTLLGLLMITVGTGGIKPCVTAFGGDQFKLPEQERHLAIYFSVLYFSLCTASLVAKTISPILRSEVSCFGDKDCYFLAFGAPGLVIIISIIIFASAKSHYLIKNPEGNVVFDFIKCIASGLKTSLVKSPSTREKPTGHWLDTTEHRFGKAFVRDVKKTLSILRLFTVLPVFWALLDQLGSRWTLQATKMDGYLGFVTIKPDQMQVLAPTFILMYIPLTQKYIYPFLEKRNILRNPLHKLTLGGVLAGLAFISSGIVEIYLKTTYPVLPSPGLGQLRIYNGNPCSVFIENSALNTTYTIPPLAHYSRNDFKIEAQMTVTFGLKGSCIEQRQEVFLLEENAAISFYLTGNDVVRYVDRVEKSKAGFPVVSFLVPPTLDAANLTFYNNKRHEVEASIFPGLSQRLEMFASTYSVWAGDHLVEDGVVLRSGGVYVVMLDETSEGYVARVIVVTEPNSITMAWLLPQFLIMSAAEVLFAVTGYEFAFKESPENMKAVMTAMFLLTDAMGNILIIVVTRLFADYSQETQSFIYTGMIFMSISVFHWMSRGYKFKTSTEDIALKCNTELDGVIESSRTEDVGRKYRSNSLGYQSVRQFED